MSDDILQNSKLEQLLKWAKSNGAHIDDRITFQYSASKGVHASVTSPITKETDNSLLAIPQALTVTPNFAEEHFGPQHNLTSNSNALLQLYLAKLKFFNSKAPAVAGKEEEEQEEQEKAFSKQQQQLAPYIDFLPSLGKQTKSPFFWTDEEKSLLKGTDAGIIVQRRFETALLEWKQLLDKFLLLGGDGSQKQYSLQFKKDLEFYNDYKKGLYDNGKLSDFLNAEIKSWSSFPAYLWATSIFNARAFPCLIFSKDNSELGKPRDINQAFLLPIVDLLNHKNGAKVQWNFNKLSKSVEFKSMQTGELGANDELYNNYGDKSNLELLLGYGFVLDDNQFDETSITLKFDASHVFANAKKCNIRLPEPSPEGAINFTLSRENALPQDLVDFFAILVQLKSEVGQYTLRMKLDGLANLKQIIEQKIEFFKTNINNTAAAASSSPQVIKTVKTYKSTQRKLFQTSLEELSKVEKKLLKTHKPLSFKTVLKNDKTFMNSLLLTLGVTSYDDIVKKQILDQVFLLWIVRASNHLAYAADKNNKDKYKFPEFVISQFKDVASTIAVTKEDVLEYMDLYKNFVVRMKQKVPQVYDAGDWGVKQLIIAGTVAERVGYTRAASSELFILDKVLLL